MDDMLKWVEEHPALAAVIGVGGVFILLWLFGFFSSSSQASGNSGQSNLAAAYYAAEAAQTTAGTQLNIATENDQAQVQLAQLQANAATGIAQTQADMYTTINGQNVGSANTINQNYTNLTALQAQDALLTTVNNNQTAVSENQTNQAYALQTQTVNNQANEYLDAVNNIAVPEIAMYGSAQFNTVGPGGVQQFTVAPQTWTPSTAAMAGFNPAALFPGLT